MLLRLPDMPEPGEHPAADRPEAERALAVEFVGCFEGWSLITIACDHRPYWMLAEIAGVLGVDDRTRLLGALAERWIAACPEGAIVQLDGGDRRELLDRLERAHVVLDHDNCLDALGRSNPRLNQRRSITLLGSLAIDELCARFDSAVARRLHAHLRDQVVPEFHAWERATRILEQPILSSDAATIAGNRLEFERRCFEAAVLERLLDRLEQSEAVDPELLAAHRVVASELALGGWLEDYEDELAHGWATPTQIAERWCGMTAMRLGKLIAELGLRGSRAHSRAYLNKARGHERTVICHAYSPAAVGLIERELHSRGYRRCAELDARECIGAMT
jgi:hypothetical protein